MSALGIMAVAAAASAIQFECNVMSHNGFEPDAAHSATLRIEHGDKSDDVTLETADSPDLSGRNRNVKIWPASIKTRGGRTINIGKTSTQSTHMNANTALLITEGGDFTVVNLPENDEAFVAVGICSEKREIRQ